MMASVLAQLGQAYGQIGAQLGTPYQQVRPLDPLAPLAPAPMATLKIAFDVSASLAFTTPAGFGKPIYFAGVDPAQVQVGDYLIGKLGTLFVAGLEDGKPPLCPRCNATLAFYRPTSSQPGADFYGGNDTGTGTVLMAGWPGSLLKGSKGERGDDPLPGDARLPWMEALLPAAAGVTLRTDDLCIDDEGRRFIVSTVELSALGWRLEMMFAGT